MEKVFIDAQEMISVLGYEAYTLHVYGCYIFPHFKGHFACPE